MACQVTLGTEHTETTDREVITSEWATAEIFY